MASSKQSKTRTQSQQQQPRQPDLKAADQMTGYLVKAQTTFDRVVRADQSGLVWDRELKFALQIILHEKGGYLQKCVPDTITAAMENIAHVGLTLNPIKHHCTLIARWNKDLSVFECNFVPMYRGLVYLATQAGVTDIVTDVVYKADVFKIGRNSEGDYFEHSINTVIPRTDDGDEESENFFLGVYVAARMPGSKLRKVEWIPREDIHKMRDLSDSYLDAQGNVRPSSPWVVWHDEQAKKSGLKRASKRWEEEVVDERKWSRFQQAVDLDHRASGITLSGSTDVAQPIQRLSLDQVADIDKRVADIGLANPMRFVTRICNAYGVQILQDVPAEKYAEVLERIKHAKEEAEKKRKTEEGKK